MTVNCKATSICLPVSTVTLCFHSLATRTNAQGRFFFSELPHGLYDVRAYHNGMASEWKHNVTVETGKQIEVALQLTVNDKRLD